MIYQEKIGEYLLRTEEMYPRQVENVLLRQQCGDRRRFGEIAVDLRYIDRKTLETCLSGSDLPLWTKQKTDKTLGSSASDRGISSFEES
ncbi:hypothetical protein [Marispirochaeta aestuarii]|uniref:hypothetical protein n=1 Tax=Marispirochaeta aestuarii TaxID=1963862 RepID=UPI0029C77A0F|nr:hypothetical protein [Marispirochaeta aestuarii]